MNSTLKVSGIVIFGVLISIILPYAITYNTSKILESKKIATTTSGTHETTKAKNETVVMAENKDTAVPVIAQPQSIEPVEEEKVESKEEPKEEPKEEKVEEKQEVSTQEEVQPIVKSYEEMTTEELVNAIATGVFKLEYTSAYSTNSKRLTKSRGAMYYDNHKETYYSQKVLKGTSLKIPGRHVADDGTVRDGDGYICVAASTSYLKKGTVVKTSLGPGKVYDSGCASGTIDIYTNW